MFTNGTEDVFMAGNVATLTGSCTWLLVATFFCLPVSGTHSVVGATLGFSMVINGVKGIGWVKLGMIVGSWVVSPLMSGLASAGLFKFIDVLVLQKETPLDNGLLLLPLFYAVTLAVNLFSVFYKGSELLHFHKIPFYGTMILTFGSAILVAIFVRIFIVPRQRKHIQERIDQTRAHTTIDDDNPVTCIDDALDQEIHIKIKEAEPCHSEDIENHEQSGNLLDADVETGNHVEEDEVKIERDTARSKVNDKPEVAGLFTFLQVLTAVFGSFAHGGNDVSNAIGPLVALWVTATTGSAAQKVPVPIWVLVYGGIGIAVGLWIWGRRVMKTMGEDLTKLTPSSGFCIEVGSALTVLVASNVGIPISTTHCKVGSVVCVGRLRSNDSVDWKLFRNIIIAWCVTLPVSGGLSALSMLGYNAILNATK